MFESGRQMAAAPLLRLAHPAIEGPHAHTQTLGRLTPHDSARLTGRLHELKLRRTRLTGPTKTHTSDLRRLMYELKVQMSASSVDAQDLDNHALPQLIASPCVGTRECERILVKLEPLVAQALN